MIYAFADTDGMVKCGRYNGNGNNDGVYVNLGFKPRLVIWKKTSGGDNWQMQDSDRDSNFNPVENNALFPNNESTEGSGRKVDFVASGFKMRNGDGNTNENGHNYVFWAWAENPLIYSGAR